VIPATVGGVVTLVLLVLPGLAFELIRQRRRSGRNDSTFVEISRVVVAGLGLGGITITVLAGVSLVGPCSIVSVAGLITNERWIGQHLLVSGWTAWAYGLVSVTLAALVAAILPGTNAAGSIHTESGWVTSFDRLPRRMQAVMHLPATPVVRLSVRLTDGSVYVADRAEFSTDLPLEDRELALGGALLYQPPGATNANLLTEWQRVLLRGDQISDMLVQYVAGVAPTWRSSSESSNVAWLRGACAKVLGRPSESTWPELLEAPATYPATAARLLAAELLVLVVVAALSRLA
jgi:hypothetical protein